MTSSGFLLRTRVADDDAALIALFNRVFAHRDPTFVPHTLAWWRWKYSQNPAGSRNVVAEDAAGRVVAHYGGVPMRVRAEGETFDFSQNCDCFADESARRGLKNPGVVLRLAQAYASTYARLGQDAVMYGVGTPEAYRLGVKYLDYWMLRTQPILYSDDARRLPDWDPTTHAVPVDRFDARCDVFANAMESRYRCVGRRDAAFLNWRFAEAPHATYGLVRARTGDRDDHRGHAVFRVCEYLRRKTCLIVDWFVPPDDDGAARSLLRRIAEGGAVAGCEGVAFLCPVSSYWFARFQDWGFRAEPSGYVACARPYDARLPSAYLRDHWWYTFADFDVV